MKELLEELIAKFNECRADGLNYRTYKDKNLEEAFAKAEAFLKGESVEAPEETEVKKSKSKK